MPTAWEIEECAPPEEAPPASLAAEDTAGEPTAADLMAIASGVVLPPDATEGTILGDASSRGWGPGWPTRRDADQVRIRRGGVRPLAAWVHGAIAPLVVEGLRRTEDEVGYAVRILKGYASRPIGHQSTPSSHGWGLALAINEDRNPIVFGPVVTDIPRQAIVVWNSLGFGWGGDYMSRKDAMHFEFLGTPAQAADLIANLRLDAGQATRRTGGLALL